MIGTVMRISWLSLKRDRVGQGLTFGLPIVFFSIFAVIFGGMGGAATRRISVAVVDEDQTPASQRFVEALVGDASLNVTTRRGDPPEPLTREDARALVAGARLPVAVIVRTGFSEQFGGFWNFVDDERPYTVDVLVDRSDPVAPQVINGLLQKAAMTSVPDLMMERGIDMFEQHAGALTGSQRNAIDHYLGMLRRQQGAAAAATRPADESTTQPSVGEDTSAGEAGFAQGLVKVNVVDLLAEDPNKSPTNAFYAAAVAVLFLLFTTTASAGILLEEEQNGTLERLLISRLTMSQLLIGRLAYVWLLGMIQLTIMFLWGWAVFGVDLFTGRHLAGFVVMAAATSAAAAGFGLVLATACRTRAQLDGLGTMIILIMSAIGGCMVPRFIMPAWMKDVGLITFNAWALDGFQKVFWYERSVVALWPQVSVLVGLAIAFVIVARILARRWETV